jgi:hypothetical protein
VRAWIASRQPPAPTALLEALEVAARGTSSASSGDAVTTQRPSLAAGSPTSQLPEELVAVGILSLGRVLDAGAASRDSALDLLSSDAFVTYAFEAAADEPATVAERAGDAMRRISLQAEKYLA